MDDDVECVCRVTPKPTCTRMFAPRFLGSRTFVSFGLQFSRFLGLGKRCRSHSKNSTNYGMLGNWANLDPPKNINPPLFDYSAHPLRMLIS